MIRSQSSFLENLCNLFNGAPVKIHGHSIVIPKFGKFPNLINCQDFSAFKMISLTPFFNPFFRPEEKHGCSGKDEVIVPM